jgi:hypothetical protein
VRKTLDEAKDIARGNAATVTGYAPAGPTTAALKAGMVMNLIA